MASFSGCRNADLHTTIQSRDGNQLHLAFTFVVETRVKEDAPDRPVHCAGKVLEIAKVPLSRHLRILDLNGQCVPPRIDDDVNLTTGAGSVVMKNIGLEEPEFPTLFQLRRFPSDHVDIYNLLWRNF